jgi:acyl-CoA synthetase (AMP-forming)/AMP-acid ligase II
MAAILADSGAACVFVSEKLSRGLAEVIDRDGPATTRVVIGSAAWRALFSGAPGEPLDLPAQTLAWLFYTSGTTGRSKGAMLSHRSLMTMTVAHLADCEAVDEYCTLIQAAPTSHGSGMYVLPYVARGARQVVPSSGGFDPDEVLELCEHHPGCGMFLAPTMVQRLRVSAQARGRTPRHLRSIVYGGGPMYVQELKKSIEVFGQVFVQIYGQGESPMTITWLSRQDHAAGDDARLGSVGRVRTGAQVAVVDETGRPLPCGQIGEVVVAGDHLMLGYWGNEQATAQALRNGWLWTGDMGSMDENGYLTLRDRSKDVVISGGSNIYPREVEEALLEHPAVIEVSVVGQPDPEWGEVVVAFVVAQPGIDAQVLDGHCLERIARFKRPKRYLFVESLPKNSYGKVLKRELRLQLEG